ncbi:MAG: zinc metallopeptidase, partial [Prevotellaceae bacterium]|nr:zinc metallopeptidase [Prevotellaceae bacterium]
PVEIDASKRALLWLDGAGITSGTTQEQAKDALKSAAYTYVVAAFGSLATLIYYILIFSGRRN